MFRAALRIAFWWILFWIVRIVRIVLRSTPAIVCVRALGTLWVVLLFPLLSILLSAFFLLLFLLDLFVSALLVDAPVGFGNVDDVIFRTRRIRVEKIAVGRVSIVFGRCEQNKFVAGRQSNFFWNDPMLDLRAILVSFFGDQKFLGDQARSAIFQMEFDRAKSVVEIDSRRLNIQS